MRELTEQEVEQVSGGQLTWKEGGLVILGLSAVSPAVACFGVPIGISMLAVDYMLS